ncbi:putative phosphoserine phosphatase [Helianthus annuus]|nr:putative phosphoserine phosphatase [Helianthus annuus]
MDLDLPVDPNLTSRSCLVAAADYALMWIALCAWMTALLEKLAMGGAVPFEEAFAGRLDLFKPSSAVHYFLEKRPPRLSSGIRELVQKLKESGKTGYLISRGFCQRINVRL